MKLFFALGSFYPAQTGGADNSAYWMVRALAKKGHQVSVATTNSGLKPGDVEFDRWKPTEFGEVVYVRTLIHYLPLRLFWYSLRRALRADVVHLNAVFYPISILLGYACALAGKRVVWSVHGELAPEALRYSPRRKKIFLALLGFIKHRAVFHATSPKEAGYVRQVLGASVRVKVIPLFLELPPRETRQTGQPYLLFVGRLHTVKALDRLFDALAAVPEFRTGGWHLKVVGIGEPEYEKALREQVNQLGLTDRVQFLGFRAGEEKYRLMASARATVLPSHTENFSVIVVESLSQGTPVLASIHTPWEILEETGAGWWTDNQVPVLASALQNVIKLDEAACDAYRDRAYRLATEHFDIKRHIGEWTTLYDQVSRGLPVSAESSADGSSAVRKKQPVV
ncbi:glycosyltransferase [Tellurirhabdus rosea]|uniref:glycosyltransferase n=1 Tax=Tellurirhabdus rosea TaxID=2674997 RepID=UPI002252987A|nr:glycosyltransferase [Tellurirhabdus rosea]